MMNSSMTLWLPLVALAAGYLVGYRGGKTKGHAEALGEAHAVWSMVIAEAAKGKDTVVLKIKAIVED